MSMVERLLRTKSHLGYKWWRLKRSVRSMLATVNESPILVLGNQKSGTTAIAALIAEQAGLSATLDIEEMTADDERAMHRRERGVEHFVASHELEFSRDLIKEPRLTFLFDKLRHRFPDGRYVFIVRDPRDNIRSILDRVGLPGDRDRLGEHHHDGIDPVWQLVLDGQWMGLTGEHYVEMLAARWKRAARVYLANQDDFFLIRYEDFLADKVRAISDLTDRLGLKQRHVIGDKVDVQYQPRGNRAVDWDTFFGKKNLSRIEQRCGSVMDDLGYAPAIRTDREAC